jgi:hypothetical protein
MLGIIVLVIAMTGTLAWIWSGGIDYMRKETLDSDTRDLLDLTEEEKKDII